MPTDRLSTGRLLAWRTTNTIRGQVTAEKNRVCMRHHGLFDDRDPSRKNDANPSIMDTDGMFWRFRSSHRRVHWFLAT